MWRKGGSPARSLCFFVRLSVYLIPTRLSSLCVQACRTETEREREWRGGHPETNRDRVRLVLALVCCGIYSLFCWEELNWSHKQAPTPSSSFLSSSTEMHTCAVQTGSLLSSCYSLLLPVSVDSACVLPGNGSFLLLLLWVSSGPGGASVVVTLHIPNREKLGVPTLVFPMKLFRLWPFLFSSIPQVIFSTCFYSFEFLLWPYYFHLWLRGCGMCLLVDDTNEKSRAPVLRTEHQYFGNVSVAAKY